MSQDINTTINAELKKPFDQSVLGTLKKGGTSLTYVPGAEVIARLNSVLGTENWSIVATEAWRDEGTIVAKVTLEAIISGQSTQKIQYGGQAIKFKKQSDNEKANGLPKEPLDLGDEYKGAVTDAFKKAATQLGVGLELARKEEALRYEEQEETAKEITAARAALPKADEDAKKDIADSISELDASQKSALKKFFTDERLPALASDDLTEDDAVTIRAKIVELSA